jgi:D-alanyl-D-alanine carboxypeptidase
MMNNENLPKEDVSVFLIIANVTLVALVLSFGTMIYRTKSQQVADAQKSVRKVDKTAFENLNLQAKSVLVWDVVNNRPIFAKDENTPRPLASLTKVMTALTAVSILPKNTVVVVRKEFLDEEGDSGLYVDEKWNLKKLIDFSLIVSSNDGMKSIASVAGAFGLPQQNYDMGLKDFINKMNQTAKTLGLNTMYFNNETGLDGASGQNGGMASAKDMTALMEYVVKKYPDLMEATKEKTGVISSYDKKHTVKNTDEIVNKIPNLIASKTGYTDQAGGNLSVVFDAGVARPIVITVLGSTYDGRFSDVQKLASSTVSYLQNN